MPRRDGGDLARVLFERAAGDARALDLLAEAVDIPDHVAGFHAQQAVEKLVKAVLSAHDVAYGRTHDVGRLVELVDQNGIPAPPEPDRLVSLTPWATALRYGEDPVDPGPLDRDEARRIVESARRWAEGLLAAMT